MKNTSFLSGIIKALLVGVILLDVAVISLSVFMLYQSKLQHEKQAATETQNLSYILEKSISGLIDNIDLILMVSVDEIQNQIKYGNVDPHKITDFIKLQHERVPEIYNLRITDEKGVLRYASDLSIIPAVDYADRDYFLYQRDNAEGGLYISKPVFGKTTEKWLLVISRRINSPDGSFAGIVSASISMKNIIELMAINIDPNYLISLRDRELGLISISGRFNKITYSVGSKRLSLPFINALKVNPNKGTYVSGPTSIDGISRTVSYLKFEKYPLYINSGISKEVSLARWHTQLLQTGGLVLALILSSSVFSLLLIRLLKRQAVHEDELEKDAHIDYLTGINNRRFFMQQAELELARTKRYNTHLSILTIDIDFFKNVNDNYGHKVGDQVLKGLAVTFIRVLRDIDIIGRIGGEEFAILLPETDKTNALDAAERLRAAIADNLIPIENGLPIQVTVSIGVSSLGSNDDNLDVLLRRSDEALYEAKKTGRNKVFCYPKNKV